MTALYIFCVANVLILWAYRSLYETDLKGGMTAYFGWKHYAIGFVLCFVPVLNIITGLLNLQWALHNLPFRKIGAK